MNDRQKEIMVITQEECAEVIQEISKIFRFGLDEVHKNGLIHRNKLEQEIGDLLCMIDLLVKEKIINQDNIEKLIIEKQNKLKKWSNIYK